MTYFEQRKLIMTIVIPLIVFSIITEKNVFNIIYNFGHYKTEYPNSVKLMEIFFYLKIFSNMQIKNVFIEFYDS